MKQFVAYMLSVCMVVSSLFIADLRTVEAAAGDTTTVYSYNPDHYSGTDGAVAWVWKDSANYTGGF